MQMAIDEWLLEQHQLDQSLSVLRFYTWTPPAISLGYHQRQWPNHWNCLIWQGQQLDLVRRPSGGRAVLHHGDLTYALITSGMTGSRRQVYQKLCQFLIEGWRSLHVPLHYGTAGRSYIRNPNCFGTATGADLIMETGAKFIGSAQLRRGQAILQHGSMQLHPNPTLVQQVFDVSLDTAPKMLKIDYPFNTIIQALTTAACQCFSVDLQVHPLSPEEWESISIHFKNRQPQEIRSRGHLS